MKRRVLLGGVFSLTVAACVGALASLVTGTPGSILATGGGGGAQGAAPFDSGRAWEHLRQMVAFGPRPSGSAALAQARAYIARQIGAVGLRLEEQAFTARTPKGAVEMVNLVVRLPGRRPEKILISGHYDTKIIRDSVFVGANDGGSSAAMLIELARGLKDRPREFTWEIVWFDGEEAVCFEWTECRAPDGSPDNTDGSRHYVQAARQTGDLLSIRAMILLDMVGARDLKVRRDTQFSERWLVDVIWARAKGLGYGSTFSMPIIPSVATTTSRSPRPAFPPLTSSTWRTFRSGTTWSAATTSSMCPPDRCRSSARSCSRRCSRSSSASRVGETLAS